MALHKTSVQIDPEVRKQLEKALYPGYTISEIVRLALEYVLDTKPEIVESRTRMQAKDRKSERG